MCRHKAVPFVSKIFWYSLFLSSIVIAQKETNIINYFASNNQVIGVPVIKEENIFRFYPDLSFQEAIINARVLYYVTNDVYENYLIQREQGRFWECNLRDFELGESIQRVEVIVECDKGKLNKILNLYNINTSKDNFNNYLLLRRGDDRALLAKSIMQERKRIFNEYKNIIIKENKALKEMTKTSIDSLKANINKKLDTVQSTFDSINGSISSSKDSIATLVKQIRIIKKLDKRKNLFTNFQDNFIFRIKDSIDLKTVLKDSADITRFEESDSTQFAIFNINNLKEFEDVINTSIYIPDSTWSSVQAKLKKISKSLSADSTALANIVHSLKFYGYDDSKVKIIPDNVFDFSFVEKSREIASLPVYEPTDPQIAGLYNAYVENRNSSLLDIRYKKNNKNIIEFAYRNDKRSLQYLQASDPVEKLGIFRVRLVPFAIYGKDKDDNVKWQNTSIIYEIALNFGSGVIKDDNFRPVLFDINRLGIGIGISANTFGSGSDFLSISLSYDINTYSTISFGANVKETPGFYMGVGINSRAFKDLVEASAHIF